LDQEETGSAIVMFDGVCNVCNASVNFIIDRDGARRFRFASLQSEAGRALCAQHGIAEDVRTIVLVQGGRAYTESTAVLRVARQLDRPWSLLYALIAVPRVLRDFAYRIFSANRYRWFGRREMCRVPTPELRARFLDA
jgi:predicted DCC family thiol-disulfide oxidoreductase YuxK